jgi:RNA polymerase sigma-70 factor, ECF subfamily
VTDPGVAGHSTLVISAPETEDTPLRSARTGEPAVSLPSFTEIYAAEFDFVWRSLRRLGVSAPVLNDAAQEVFLVVHRRLGDFEGRSSLRTWLFAIVLRVASQLRRSARRHPEEALPDDLPASWPADPQEGAARAEALRLVYQLLDALDDDKRIVFVLAELEQMTAPEIAETLSLKLNTVYSRLRAARRDFDAALARVRSGETRQRR